MRESSRVEFSHRGARRLDAATFLTVYLVLLFATQQRWVVGPLGGAGSPAQLLALAGLGWWIYFQVQRPQPTGWGAQPVRIALLLLLLAFAASYVVAMARPIDSVESSTSNLGMVGLLGWLGVVLLAHDGIPGRERFDQIVDRLVFAGTAMALLALAQFLSQNPLIQGVHFPGLVANTAAGGLFNRSGFDRPPGTAIHPIEFGAVMTAVLPIAITRARIRPGIGVVRGWFPVVTVGLGIVISGSRSAVLCALVALAALTLTWSVRERVLAAVAVFFFLAFVAAAVPGMLGTLAKLFTGIGNDGSVASRTGSYSLVGEFFSRSPVLGRGYSTFLPSYRILDNQYLLLLVEVGALGFCAFLGLMSAAALCASRVRKRAADTATRETGQALLASILASAVGLATYDGLSFPTATGVQFLVFGLAGALYRLADRGGSTDEAAPATPRSDATARDVSSSALPDESART